MTKLLVMLSGACGGEASHGYKFGILRCAQNDGYSYLLMVVKRRVSFPLE